ncbi:MAG: ureidoglycolate hydrolase, partial [Rhodospirillales bacterium]|nr:ureidoglycolate hydrolase [Rhodospirillales bacterium]
VFPVTPAGRFFDKQGKVHARVSCDLAHEFGVLLSVPLPHAI